MSTVSSPREHLTLLSAGALISGILGSALYFDHQRRGNADRRRSIRKENRRLERAAAKERLTRSPETTRMLQAIIADVHEETDYMFDVSAPEIRQCYFLEQSNQGEYFMTLSGFHNDIYAASHFFRAVRVTQQDTIQNLLHIYRITQRPLIYSLVQELLSMVKEEKWFLLGPLTDPFNKDGGGGDRPVSGSAMFVN